MLFYETKLKLLFSFFSFSTNNKDVFSFLDFFLPTLTSLILSISIFRGKNNSNLIENMSRSIEKQTIDDGVDDRDDRQSKLLLLFSEQWRDLFENYISKELNQFDLKQLYSSFKDARLAIKRSGIRLQTRFKITELTSISQLEVAWDNYHYGVGWHSGWFCQRVAEMNKLEYLVWLREVKNCDWDLRTINRAAKQGNLAIVKYCVENGCPMDAYACKIAASEGHLDVLKYLHENDCPWNSSACYYAHRENQIDCLNYLIEQKCEGFEEYIQ